MKWILLILLLETTSIPGVSLSTPAEDPLAGFEGFTARQDRTHWSPFLTTGFDALLHSYPLATSDTTETITEYVVSAGIEGRSPRKVHHRWRFRLDGSVGSELFRQQFEGQYKYLDRQRVTRFRLDGRLYGRQYRQTTEYSLSSNNLESRLDLRGYPWQGSRTRLELRGWHNTLDYAKPSTLEVNARETGAGVFLRNSRLQESTWSLGYRVSGRTYPDTTGINRTIHRGEGELDFHDENGQGIRLFHKSGRRLITDETLRPSAWAHWTEFQGLVTAGSGFIYLDLQSEVWRYDEKTDVYFDSWRLENTLGYRWGDVLGTIWRLGLTSEKLAAGESPEAYSQFGFRVGVESFASDLSGSLQLELGRRMYDQWVAGEDLLEDDLTSFYSDFNYWKIWLMASWEINGDLSLDFMANYEPENHTEDTDDSSLGFGSMRLVWRP